jgi:hypothetical protein
MHTKLIALCWQTFIGVKYVEFLLHNKKVLQLTGPILCICQTNHALDQFLKMIHDRQKLPVGDLIRVGGRSKESWTGRYTLNSCRKELLTRASSSRTEHENRLRVQAKLKELSGELQRDTEYAVPHPKRVRHGYSVLSCTGECSS